MPGSPELKASTVMTACDRQLSQPGVACNDKVTKILQMRPVLQAYMVHRVTSLQATECQEGLVK